MATIIQRSFSGGVLAPALRSRVDLSKYKTGLKTCRNYYVMRHGGAQNRPGTRFVTKAYVNDDCIRLIPFKFSNSQSYILEFGHLYVRIIRDQALLKNTAVAISNITQASPAVVTSTGHGYTSGTDVTLSGLTGSMQVLNGKTYRIGVIDANSYELYEVSGGPLDTTLIGSYSSGGETQSTLYIVSPYDRDEIKDINFVQSADIMTIVHPNHPPKEFQRFGELLWQFADISFGPQIAAPPTAPAITGGEAGTFNFYNYVVTAVSSTTFEESNPSPAGGALAFQNPTSANPFNISWTSVAGASEYNIYKRTNGAYGLIGITSSTSIKDPGIQEDTTNGPPVVKDPFAGSNYPSTVNYFQQRLAFGNFVNNSEQVSLSQIGNFKNFNTSDPITDSDAIEYTAAGRTLNEVFHLLELRRPVVFTSEREVILEGDGGVITPTTLNPNTHSYNGSAKSPAPVVIDSNALYVQARATVIRDLSYEFSADGYRGNDLTIFASHLFDDYTINEWAYQKIPHSILWVARSDGRVLTLTYVREQNILAWSEHDFGGEVESIATIPEGDEDAVYISVKRTINGVTGRFVERVSKRNIIDEKDVVFCDSHLSYDGRNSSATTMTFQNSTSWEFDETMEILSSDNVFNNLSNGNEIHVTLDDEIIRFELTNILSPTLAEGRPHKTIPASMRNTALSTWSSAVSILAGLDHLEGESLSVQGDGHVAASALNESHITVVVSGGQITLDKPYSVIHAGLPYICDLETLNIDTTTAETLVDKNSTITHVTASVVETKGFWSGLNEPTGDDPVKGLIESKPRECEDYDAPNELKTGEIDVNIEGRSQGDGKVFIRQIDPVPSTITAIAPSGMVPFRR